MVGHLLSYLLGFVPWAGTISMTTIQTPLPRPQWPDFRETQARQSWGYHGPSSVLARIPHSGLPASCAIRLRAWTAPGLASGGRGVAQSCLEGSLARPTASSPRSSPSFAPKKQAVPTQLWPVVNVTRRPHSAAPGPGEPGVGGFLWDPLGPRPWSLVPDRPLSWKPTPAVGSQPGGGVRPEPHSGQPSPELWGHTLPTQSSSQSAARLSAYNSPRAPQHHPTLQVLRHTVPPHHGSSLMGRPHLWALLPPPPPLACQGPEGLKSRPRRPGTGPSPRLGGEGWTHVPTAAHLCADSWEASHRTRGSEGQPPPCPPAPTQTPRPCRSHSLESELREARSLQTPEGSHGPGPALGRPSQGGPKSWHWPRA